VTAVANAARRADGPAPAPDARRVAVPALPEAHEPPEARGLARDEVRLLVAAGDVVRHAGFADLPGLLAPGDVLVVNTSATLPAALAARRAGGARATLHLSTPVPGLDDDEGLRVVELRDAGGRVRDAEAGERIELPAGGEAELLAPYLGARLWVAALDLPGSLPDYLARHGRPIRYGHAPGAWPLAAYQTAFATEPGSAEMPSAGRPFTPELVTRLIAGGVDVAPLVLHTGVSSPEAGERPYPEFYRVPAASAARVAGARERGGRVVAVGTTVVRALESAADADGHVGAAGGWTNLVLGPERPARAVDGLITGFHDPDASHLDLLAAVAGPATVDRAYREAALHGYRRHEFGDVALLLASR
jgi:S-adenosylmethionine:tRNA ribosyltransferase-isomerase